MDSSKIEISDVREAARGLLGILDKIRSAEELGGRLSLLPSGEESIDLPDNRRITFRKRTHGNRAQDIEINYSILGKLISPSTKVFEVTLSYQSGCIVLYAVTEDKIRGYETLPYNPSFKGVCQISQWAGTDISLLKQRLEELADYQPVA